MMGGEKPLRIACVCSSRQKTNGATHHDDEGGTSLDVHKLAAVEQDVSEVGEGLIACAGSFAGFHEVEGLLESFGIGFMTQREHEHALDGFFERV
jgi:hypothetical protein